MALVKIKNLSSQLASIPLVRNGKADVITLLVGQTSKPIEEAELAPVVKDMARQNLIKIQPLR